jgi:hypothetical protein
LGPEAITGLVGASDRLGLKRFLDATTPYPPADAAGLAAETDTAAGAAARGVGNGGSGGGVSSSRISPAAQRAPRRPRRTFMARMRLDTI